MVVVVVVCAYVAVFDHMAKQQFSHWGGAGWGQISTYGAKKQCRSFPPALQLHTDTCAWLTTGDVATHRMQNKF